VPKPRMPISRPGRIQITGIRSAQNSPLVRAMAVVLCFALTGWAIAGCDGRSAASGDGSSPPPAATIAPLSPSPSASPEQADFNRVVQGDCLAGLPPWAEISCDDGKADAKVVGLGIGGVTGTHSAQTSCPADTDEVFNRPDGGGYFCLRKLHPPHHARPGLGGGIVVVGDCLTRHARDYVETPCDGGSDRPEYKVVDVREWKEGRCPKGQTQLSVDALGLKNYCAKKL
jgi:hypothetical protein